MTPRLAPSTETCPNKALLTFEWVAGSLGLTREAAWNAEVVQGNAVHTSLRDSRIRAGRKPRE